MNLCEISGCRFNTSIKEIIETIDGKQITKFRFVEGFQLLVPDLEAKHFKLNASLHLCRTCQKAYDLGKNVNT